MIEDEVNEGAVSRLLGQGEFYLVVPPPEPSLLIYTDLAEPLTATCPLSLRLTSQAMAWAYSSPR